MDAQEDLSLRWAQRVFRWFCHEVAHFTLSHLRQQYWFLLFRGVLFPETPRESEGFLCIHARVCLSPFIMPYCRWVVILTFIFHDASHCSYSLLGGPRGEVRVVSLMVNGYADIYKDNRRKHLRTHTMSNRRSLITTELQLFCISMLSTEPALSTVAVKPKITAFKTPNNNSKCYYCYCICVDWHDSYTWLSTVCPANTCKDFMRLYEYAGWSESSLGLLVIL